MELVKSRRTVASVLVIHSWWGLTDSIREYGATLADRGLTLGLADLFAGRTAATEPEARSLRAAPRREPIYRMLGRDIAELRAMSEVPFAGVVGFSMGGHWAVWLSQHDAAIPATVLYYAARGGDFSRSRSAYLAHFAEHDNWASASARRTMGRAIRSAGLSLEEHDYAGTQHWFAERGRPEYDADAAALALDRTVRHLREAVDRV